MMRLPEYYLTHTTEIDLSNCNNIPDAPRVAGVTSSAETSERKSRSTAPGTIYNCDLWL